MTPSIMRRLRFRERPAVFNAMMALFYAFNNRLRSNDYIAMGGQIFDAGGCGTQVGHLCQRCQRAISGISLTQNREWGVRRCKSLPNMTCPTLL
jgi:hypothetical protein